MEELLRVVVDAVRRAGGQALLHRGNALHEGWPDGHRRVALVIPHEFGALTRGDEQPPRNMTIALGVEHPGTATFEHVASLASSYAAFFDINRHSVLELERRGVPGVHHFQLGWSPVWDRWGGGWRDRDLDVTILATHDRRRDMIVRDALVALAGTRHRIVMVPEELQGRGNPSTEALKGDDKWNLLARTRLVLNAHREGSNALEWVRVVEAVCNGAVVVTEPSGDAWPLTAECLVEAADLGSAALRLLDDPDRMESIRRRAYEVILGLDTARAAVRLLEVAADLLRTTRKWDRRSAVAPTRHSASGTHGSPSWNPARSLPGSRFDAPHRRVPGPESSLAMVAQAAARRTRQVQDLRVDRLTQPGGSPDLAAIVVHPSHLDVTPVLEALASCRPCPRWVLRSATAPSGEAVSRNWLLGLLPEDVEFVHVQDGTLTPFPWTFRELLSRLNADDAVAAYGAVAEFGGLSGTLDLLPHRLARHAYLDCGAVFRRSVLERYCGYAVEPWLDGLVDHDLWVRLIDQCETVSRVPRLLWVRSGMNTPTGPFESDPETVLEVLSRRAPRIAASDPFPLR